jgi:hypothetical protein
LALREGVTARGEPQALAWQLAKATRRAEKRAGEAQALAARLKQAERRAREAQGLADAARAEAEMLRRSTSWRLTTPLRSVLKVLGRG